MKKIRLISMLALLSLVGSHGFFSTIEKRNSSPNQNSTIFLYSSELLVDGYTKNENLNENLIIPREINDLILTYYFDSFQYLTDLFKHLNCTKTIRLNLMTPYTLSYYSLCYNAKDKTLFAATRDGIIEQFSNQEKDIKITSVDSTNSSTICYEPLYYDAENKTLFARTRKRTIERFYFNNKGECIKPPKGNQFGSFYLFYDPEINTLIACKLRIGTIKLWDIDSSECTNTLIENCRSYSHLFYDPKIKVLISGNCADGVVKLWDIQEGKCETLIEDRESAYRLFYDPKIGTLISCNRNGNIDLWDIKNKKCIKTFYTPTDHKANTNYPLYDDKSKILFATNSNDGDARQIREIFRNDYLNFHKSSNSIIANNGDIKLWNTKNGECIMTLKGDIGEVTALCYDDKSKILFSGESNGNIKLWDIISRKCFLAFKGHKKRVDSLGYDAKTKTLLSYCQNSEIDEIKVWGINLNSAIDHDN